MANSIKQQEKLISDLTLALDKAKTTLYIMQAKTFRQARLKVLRKYLKLFKDAPLWSFDPDLLNTIFYLARVQQSPVPTMKTTRLPDGQIIMTYCSNTLQETVTL